MAPNDANNELMYRLTIMSEHDLTDAERDFIAELASEEARKAISAHTFTIHEIVESRSSSRLLVEGSPKAVHNLCIVIRDNLPYQVTSKRLR